VANPERTDDHSSRVYPFEGDLANPIYQLGVGDVDGSGITGTIRYILSVKDFFFPSARSRGDCGDNNVCQFGFGFVFGTHTDLLSWFPITASARAANPTEYITAYGDPWTTNAVYFLRVLNDDMKYGPTLVHSVQAGYRLSSVESAVNLQTNNAFIAWTEQNMTSPFPWVGYVRRFTFDGVNNVPQTGPIFVSDGVIRQCISDPRNNGIYAAISNINSEGRIARIGESSVLRLATYDSSFVSNGYDHVSIAADPGTGNIAVAWLERADINLPYYVCMMILNSELNVVTPKFTAVTGMSGSLPAGEDLYEVLAVPGGGFSVFWGTKYGAQVPEDPVAWRLYARRFSATGVPQGASVLVRTFNFMPYGSSGQNYPEGFLTTVTVDPTTGNFYLAYEYSYVVLPEDRIEYEARVAVYSSALVENQSLAFTGPGSSYPGDYGVFEVLAFGSDRGAIIYRAAATTAARFSLGCLPDPGFPILSLNENPFVFEDTSVGDSSAVEELIATNIGSRILIISEFSDGPPFVFDHADLPVGIQPGASFTFSGVFSPKVAGDLSRKITIVSNAGTSPDIIDVKGKGVFGVLFLGVQFAFNNLSTNPQTINVVTPANVPDGSLMLMTLASRGAAWTIDSPGWTIIERSEAYGNAKNGAPSIVVAFKTKTPADVNTQARRVNDTSRLAQGQIAFYGTNRVGGSWSLISSSVTRGFSATDTFTGAGVNIGYEDVLLILSTFNAATPYAPHKSIRSSALPYDRIPDKGGWAPSNGWTFQGLNGWTQGSLPLASNWVDQIHLRGAPPVTGDITWTLGDATSPRINLNHAMVVSAFRYLGGEFGGSYAIPDLSPKAFLLGSSDSEVQQPVTEQRG
jgi:hypothetical protein